MDIHHTINYLEYGSKDLEKTKIFFEEVFNWVFEDYGPEYTAFSDLTLNGGFFKSEQTSLTINGGALSVLYSEDLEETLTKVKSGGAKITKDIFEFPGGKRFQFVEPGGNEFAVWTKI